MRTGRREELRTWSRFCLFVSKSVKSLVTLVFINRSPKARASLEEWIQTASLNIWEWGPDIGSTDRCKRPSVRSCLSSQSVSGTLSLALPFSNSTYMQLMETYITRGWRFYKSREAWGWQSGYLRTWMGKKFLFLLILTKILHFFPLGKWATNHSSISTCDSHITGNHRYSPVADTSRCLGAPLLGNYATF